MITVLIAVVLGAATLLAPVRADDPYPCCLCGNEIEIFITVQNLLIKATEFKKETEVEMGQRELLFVLEKAADSDPEFMFTASYRPPFGYILQSVNGVTAPPGTYWKITNGAGVLIFNGLSHYVPHNSEVIKISLETGSHFFW